MGMLIDGKWSLEHVNAGPDGRYVRRDAQFRNRIGATGFKAEPGRYHIYAAHACPWAHRTVIFRKLKGLEDAISLSYVEPEMLEGGWSFGGAGDPLYGARHVHEIYQRADPAYTGRCSVPVLWDKKRETIVNNESSEIIRILNEAFDAFGDAGVDFYPEPLRATIDAINEDVYRNVNNGVYRTGFSTTQDAYDEAVDDLFACLDRLEALLSGQRYLVGDRVSEADWRLFATLVRFDAVYVGHFKCNLRRIADYPHLSNYVRELYQYPGIAGTVDIPRIKRHYYYSHRAINPTGIVPKGPVLDFAAPHDRDRFASVAAE